MISSTLQTSTIWKYYEKTWQWAVFDALELAPILSTSSSNMARCWTGDISLLSTSMVTQFPYQISMARPMWYQVIHIHLYVIWKQCSCKSLDVIFVTRHSYVTIYAKPGINISRYLDNLFDRDLCHQLMSLYTGALINKAGGRSCAWRDGVYPIKYAYILICFFIAVILPAPVSLLCHIYTYLWGCFTATGTATQMPQ